MLEHKVRLVGPLKPAEELRQIDSFYTGDIDRNTKSSFEESSKEIDDRYSFVKKLEATNSSIRDRFLEISNKVAVLDIIYKSIGLSNRDLLENSAV